MLFDDSPFRAKWVAEESVALKQPMRSDSTAGVVTPADTESFGNLSLSALWPNVSRSPDLTSRTGSRHRSFPSH
jgi:hypothetical protein